MIFEFIDLLTSFYSHMDIRGLILSLGLIHKDLVIKAGYDPLSKILEDQKVMFGS